LSRRKGFTLIEIMIVLAVVGILSMVLIPKVGSIKLNSKNNSVTTNVLLVRTYLENRAGKDGISYNISTKGSPAKAPEEALQIIHGNVGADMTSNFSGSNTLINPFNSNSSINYTQGNVTSNNPAAASVVIGYNGLDPLPSSKSFVKDNLPKGQDFIGDVVVVIYGIGYVLYGVDNDGDITDIYIIKFPPAPPIVQSGVDPGNGGGGDDTGIYGNIGDVVRYLKSIAIERIISGVPLNKTWQYMRTPLFDDLSGEFTPGTSKSIVNPYFSGIDEIFNNTGTADTNINTKYSIISNREQGPNIEAKFSGNANRQGTIIVYVSDDPIGYGVYGIDKNGNNVGQTLINLGTEVTDYMTSVLENNIDMVHNVLRNNINRLVLDNPNNKAGMANGANNVLKGLGISNSYIPGWKNTGVIQSTSFLLGYSIVCGANISEQSSFSDYKGTTVVNVLDDGKGFEIFGVNYKGEKIKSIKLRVDVTAYNAVVDSNYEKVRSYLDGLNQEADHNEVTGLLRNNFNQSLKNPTDMNWSSIAIDGNSNINNSVVVISDHNAYVDYTKYKGCVIVKAHDGSDKGKKYYVYDIGFNGTVLKSSTVDVKK
jgi:prepilin-type N-terminal cleavage/methylation domain-containing protein